MILIFSLIPYAIDKALEAGNESAIAYVDMFGVLKNLFKRVKFNHQAKNNFSKIAILGYVFDLAGN